MKFIYVLLFVTFFYQSSISQVKPFQISYGGTKDDIFNSIISLNTNGYILLGTTNNFSSKKKDLFLAKINDNGTPIWINRYGGTEDETAEHIELTSDGGYILLASTTSYGIGKSDLLVIKTNNKGEIEWSKTYGGLEDDIAACIKEVPSGGYIIAGRTESFGQGGEDAYLIRVTNNGNMMWSKSYGTTNNERFYYVSNTNNGFIITGIENTSKTLNYDQLVIKTDLNGRILFNFSYGDNGGSSDDASDCIKQTSDGGYAFSGHYQSLGYGGLDFALTKIKDDGTFEWTRLLGKAGDERAWDFQIDKSNNYLLAGYTNSYGNGENDALAVLLNSTGTPTWTKTYGGKLDEEFKECIINEDSIVFVGYTQSKTSGGRDFLVVKTDYNAILAEGCTGVFQSIKTSSVIPKVHSVNQTETILNRSTIITSPNLTNSIISINLLKTIDNCLNPTPVTLVNFSICNENDISYLCWNTSSELNTNSFIIEQSFDGITFDSIGFLPAKNRGDQLISYKYLISNLTNAQSQYYRLKILDYNEHKDYSNIVYNHRQNEQITIYPTFFSNSFNISLSSSNYSDVTIEVTDINGLVQFKSIYSNKEIITINTEQWKQGLFLVRIINKNGKDYLLKKIIKE